MKTYRYLSSQQFDQFHEYGFLVIDGFLNAQEVETVRRSITNVCRERAGLDQDQDGFNLEKVEGAETLSRNAPIRQPGLFRKIQGAVFHVPAVKDVFTGQKMLDCMEDLMGSEVYYHSSKVMFKPPGGVQKPWHQDAAYWKDFEPKQITVWIAIDDATEENGCVWAIPGSHKLGHIPHVKAELQVEESQIKLEEAKPVPVPSGGLLIFHSLVLHMSKRNESDKPRCAIICDYDPKPNPILEKSMLENTDPTDFEGLGEDAVWPLRTTTTTSGRGYENRSC